MPDSKSKKSYSISFLSTTTVVFLLLYYLFDLKIFERIEQYIPFLKRLSMSLALITIIFLAGKTIEKIINIHTENEGNRYNLLRIIRLITVIFVFIVIISFLFQNLYAAAVSFGVISLVLGFALQAPITSFIAWLYIVFRKPYQVGHRIQIKNMRGDVVEINYLDTMILECSGDYLKNDRRSGRVVHFPNSLILREEVINYSGPEEPFIWNETPVQIAFESDLEFVEECLLKASEQDFKEKYPDIDIEKWNSSVYFRVNEYAWLEAVILYPVEPFDTTERRNRILRHALPLLNGEQSRVGFPEGSRR